ncbi:MAG: iron-sulfur cluster assembly protein [bacterium]
MNLKEKVTDRLQSLLDPELRVNVMELGLIKDLDIDNSGNVSLKFKPSSRQCPVGIQLAIAVKQSILELEGVRSVDIEVQNFIHKDKLEEILKSIE